MRPLLLVLFTPGIGIGQSSDSWIVLARQADEHQEMDDIAGSEALRWEALRTAEQQLGSNDPRLVRLSAQLAGVLHLERRDSEGEPLLRHAVETANDCGDRRLLGIALSGLGTALSGEGDVARAEPVLRRGLALLKESEGEDTIETANAANNLATLYSDTGQYPQAEKEMAVALSFYERHVNSLQTVLAMDLRNMFVILFKEQRTNEAEGYLTRALAIGEKVFPQSCRMAQLRFAQAVLAGNRGHFQEAAEILKQVISVQERSLRSNDPELAQSLLTCSAALRHLHRRSEALVAQKRGVLILKSFTNR